MIKKIAIKIIKTILAIIAFFLLYLLSAFVCSRIAVNQNDTSPDEIEIYILTNGIHSDIVVPTIRPQINWFSQFDFLASTIDSTKYKYLAIGWGDKGFYLNTPTWSELKASTAIKASIGVSGTAIHATYYQDMYESESCRKISISEEQYKTLINYLLESLDLDENKKAVKIITDANKGELDAFYEATGRYHLFNTCNTWTNRGLKESGQKACLWTIFQEPIFMKYENHKD